MTNQQVSEYWNRTAKRKELGYWDVPGWERHQNLLASGTPNIPWLEVFAQQLRGEGWKPGHALSLGCGTGYLEPLLLRSGLCTSIDACDLSPYLVNLAQKSALEKNLSIRYFIADLNNPQFSEKSYDLVVGAGIFHHILNLEVLFKNLQQALRPNGRLMLYDYVGPSRFQWTPSQTSACNQWLNQLPARYKKKRGYPWHYVAAKKMFDHFPGSHSEGADKMLRAILPARSYAQFRRLKCASLVLNQLVPPPVEQFLVTDPSEAVRSEEILSILTNYFHIECQRPQGGTLVAPLLGRLVANFLNDKEGARWADLILADERAAIQNNTLPSDLVAILARDHIGC